MKHQEKKYRVDSFNEIEKRLLEKGAIKGNEKTTSHYYADLSGNDVAKLVSKTDRCEIHILKELDGKFTLTESIPTNDVESGLQWLRDKGYTKVSKVKMINTNYEYKEGIIGLYIINDFLYSVILDFPEGLHESIEKEFDLESSEVISLPYNKYLLQKGELDLIHLN